MKELELGEEGQKAEGGVDEVERGGGKKERSVLQTKLTKLAIQIGYVGKQVLTMIPSISQYYLATYLSLRTAYQKHFVLLIYFPLLLASCMCGSKTRSFCKANLSKSETSVIVI